MMIVSDRRVGIVVKLYPAQYELIESGVGPAKVTSAHAIFRISWDAVPYRCGRGTVRCLLQMTPDLGWSP